MQSVLLVQNSLSLSIRSMCLRVGKGNDYIKVANYFIIWPIDSYKCRLGSFL